VRFKDNVHLLHIIEKIVSQVGRRIDEAQPIVDARLPDGPRVNAIMPPLALDGQSLGIRLPISGGTGSLKTTTLNALSRFIPEEERIIAIEDTADLQLQVPAIIHNLV
jgi:pilus assembly protein CpaF